MKNALLVGLVMFALQSPGAPKANSAEARKLPGEPCRNVAQLVGTWRLVDSNGEKPDSTVLKHITPTHFAVFSADPTGLVTYSHSGPITLSGGNYIESVKYGSGEPFERVLRGKTFTFKCTIADGRWYTAGEIAGEKGEETWVKELAGKK